MMKSWYLLGSISTENPFFQVPIVWVVGVGTREDPQRWFSVMYLSFFAIVCPLGTSIIEGIPLGTDVYDSGREPRLSFSEMGTLRVFFFAATNPSAHLRKSLARRRGR